MKIIAQNKGVEIKKFAFNKCLSYNYQKIDSTFYKTYKDVSGVQISLNGNFLEHDDLKNKIIDYTIAVTGLYYSQIIIYTLRQGIRILFFVIALIFMNLKI